MSEYIYHSKGTPMKNAAGKISLAREEIVRCKDCVYCDKYKNDEIRVCYRFDNEQPEVEPDGFCAWGDRKDEE